MTPEEVANELVADYWHEHPSDDAGCDACHHVAAIASAIRSVAEEREACVQAIVNLGRVDGESWSPGFRYAFESVSSLIVAAIRARTT